MEGSALPARAFTVPSEWEGLGAAASSLSQATYGFGAIILLHCALAFDVNAVQAVNTAIPRMAFGQHPLRIEVTFFMVGILSLCIEIGRLRWAPACDPMCGLEPYYSSERA